MSTEMGFRDVWNVVRLPFEIIRMLFKLFGNKGAICILGIVAIIVVIGNATTCKNEKSENKTIILSSIIPGKFPKASEKLLTASDLQSLSKNDLKIMKNEIFARHGYIFQTKEMKYYFQNQSWYTPKYSNVNSLLTDIERNNIKLIQRYE